MADPDTFTLDMAKELDATIHLLAEREMACADRLGAQRLAEIEAYRAGQLGAEEAAEFERSLDSLDREWMALSTRLERARSNRVKAGRLCMQAITGDKQPE